MSNSEQIQNSIVNMIENFEELQNQLEEKHFGKVVEEESDLQSVPEEHIANCNDEFLESMKEIFEGIGFETVEKLYTTSSNIIDACEILYDLDDDDDDEEPEADPNPDPSSSGAKEHVSVESEVSNHDAMGEVKGNSSN